MRRLIATMTSIAALSWAACTVAPTTDPTPVPTPTPIIITVELEVLADPRAAAEFVLNPKPIPGGLYLRGGTVTISVLPKEGWRVDEWIGPVYGIAGKTAKIDMKSSQTVIIRLVRLEAALQTPTRTPTPIPPTPTPGQPPPTPVPPTATPTPTLTPVPMASTDTNNLSALLPTLADLAPGAIIEGDGYVQDTDALNAYEREFAAEGLFFTLGASQLSNLSSTVELYATPSEASSPVLVMGAMDPQLFAQLAGPAFAEGAGITPENLRVEAIDLPTIGDATVGFLMRI